MVFFKCPLKGGFPSLGFFRCEGFGLTVIADPDQSLVNAKRKAFDLGLVIVNAGRPDGSTSALRTGILEERRWSPRACNSTARRRPGGQ